MQVYSPTTLRLFSQEALKLGLMGSTILASTGDNGVADAFARKQFCNPITPDCACSLNTSSAAFQSSASSVSQTKNTWTGQGYFAHFPASCPYVTAVGATMLESFTSGPEIACSSQTGGVITTGGGFSSYYARLDWQNNAVAQYFQQISDNNWTPPASGYNPLGRGYPDVALNGFSYDNVVNGFFTGASGTSASTPAFAAMSEFVLYWYLL